MSRELLILDDAPIVGGAELFALRMARWIAADRPGWTSTIACPGVSDLARRCRDAGVPVAPLAFPDLVPAAAHRMLPALRQMASLLRLAETRQSLVVANTARSQAYAAVARLGIRHPPNVVNLVHEQDTAARRSARAVFRRTGRVVAVGANNGAVYRAALPGTTVSELNNFLDPAAFAQTPTDTDTRPAGRPPAVGVLARLIPEKGVAELIAELAQIPDSWSTVRIAGGAQDPAYAAEVARRVEGLRLSSRITLDGHVSELGAFFASIDVLVVPSTGNEGQPTVILEALAAGRAVVVRRPVWSSDFRGLPVAPYATVAELAVALSAALPPAPAELLAERFGPQQALDALVAAAA